MEYFCLIDIYENKMLFIWIKFVFDYKFVLEKYLFDFKMFFFLLLVFMDYWVGEWVSG